MPRTRPTASELVVDAPLEWVEERSGFVGLVEEFLFRNVPRDTSWLQTLGSSLLIVFVLQATTGVLLAMNYDPSPAGAYNSIRFITDDADARLADPRHAQVGIERDGDPALPAHGAHVLLRGLQVPARADLADRRDPVHPGDGDVVHRLPAGVRPARLLGDGRRRQHQRHGADRRALPGQLPEGRAGVQRGRRSRASTRCTCS